MADSAFISRPLRLCHGDACAVERAADALHCRWINAEPLGNDPYARPPRSRQSLTDSFFQRRGYRRPTKPLPLAPGPRKPGADAFLNTVFSVVEGAGRNLVEGTRKADKRDDGKDAEPIREAHRLTFVLRRTSPQSGSRGLAQPPFRPINVPWHTAAQIIRAPLLDIFIKRTWHWW
jgi:hypothetical protein